MIEFIDEEKQRQLRLEKIEQEKEEKEIRAPINFGRSVKNDKRFEMINNLRKNVYGSNLTLHDIALGGDSTDLIQQ